MVSPRKYWAKAWNHETQSSGNSWTENPDQFSPGPSSHLPVGLSPRIAEALNSLADASSSPASEAALTALRFDPRIYITETQAQTSPAGVILHLANCLEQLLNEEGGQLDGNRRLKIAGVLTAAEMYADALGQPGMSELLKTSTVDDRERLPALGAHLTQLGCSLLPSSEGTAELVDAPGLATVLRSHYERILASDSATRQATQAHALAAFLGSTDPGEHDALKLACIGYVKHGGPLQAVVDALFHTIRDLDLPSPSQRQPGNTRKTLIERDDVRRNLLLARKELTSAGSERELAENAANLVSWLQQLNRTDASLDRPLERLLDACAACRASSGSAATAQAMRNALDDCMAAAAIAADQDNLGPDLSDPANAGTLNQRALQYAQLIKQAGTPYLMSANKMSTVIECYLRNPTATIATVAAQSTTNENQVREARGSLRNCVASSLSDGARRKVVACALRSANEDDFKRSSARVLDHRLVNCQAV